LLRAESEALINTVNCVGHMGKGVALRFKKAFPDNFVFYQKARRAKEVQPGRMLVFETRKMIGPRFIISFPTKQHWRGDSKYEFIQSGLNALITEVRNRAIRSISRQAGLKKEICAQIPKISSLLFTTRCKITFA
jgi:O-acetyl-ADP-ribose deacetylase (regulator of RNase III)